MKICLINNLYKPYNRGGAERIVELTAEGLLKSGYEILLITTKPLTHNKTNPDFKYPVYQIRSLNFVSYYHLPRIPKPFRLIWHLFDMFDLGAYFKIKKIIEMENPQVVVTHNLKGMSYLTPLILRKKRIKHVHVLHDIQLIHPSGLLICGQENCLNNILSKIYIKINKILFKSPALIISPSKWLLDLHASKGFFKQSCKKVLPNPIFLPTKINRSLKPGGFVFLYVGQLETHKGIFFLIEAFSRLVVEPENKISLVICGNGSQEKKAKKAARYQKNITFKKWESRERAFREMALADCLVVPSLCYENSPTVIYEAASLELPVIAPRLGGTIELVHHIGGLLYNPKNEGDLMYQMKWAINNLAALQKMGVQSRKKISKFDQVAYIKKISEFILKK